MRKLQIIALFSLTFSVGQSYAQCDALKLCAEEILNDTISEAAPISFDCFDAQNTSILFFNTNNSANNFGGVDITISSIDCPDPNNGGLLSVSVIELINPNGNPCEPLNWSTSIGCTDGSSEIVMAIDDIDLNTNSGYAILIGNDQTTGNVNCSYTVEIDGMWVDIDACCDQEITLGDITTIEAEGSDNGYHWIADQIVNFDDPNISNPTIGATISTNITVTGEVDGCVVTDVITITVSPPIEVLNTFTPNGDGINDTFSIHGMQKFPNSQVTIYDRWGQLIFKSIGYTKVWDGTNNGRELPPATYYYVIELNSLDVEIPPYTGWVAILY